MPRMLAPVGKVVDLLFPPSCPGCDHETRGASLCGACVAEITPPSSPFCPICGIPFSGRGPDHACHRCRRRRPRFARARAVATYDANQSSGRLASALFRYKYGREVVLARPLGELLAERCPLPARYDAIVPVPLHRSRLRWRGFNQALLLARPLARRWSVALDPFALQRTRPTDPQVGLDDASRRRNIAGAFAVQPGSALRGRSILLVDDVLTTGATADECARTLLGAGARRVDVLVLARVR
jgi:ComF family protein